MNCEENFVFQFQTGLVAKNRKTWDITITALKYNFFQSRYVKHIDDDKRAKKLWVKEREKRLLAHILDWRKVDVHSLKLLRFEKLLYGEWELYNCRECRPDDRKSLTCLCREMAIRFP